MARNPGMLTPGDRDKLTGKQDPTDLENISDWKGKVRDDIRATYQDMALLEESPYWDDEDFAKVYRDKHRNTGLFGRLQDAGIDDGSAAAQAQTKIYGDTLNNFADELRQLDIDGSWQDEENAERAVQEMFIRNVVKVVDDVLHLVGVTNTEVRIEFIEDVWPEKEDAVEIAREELSND